MKRRYFIKGEEGWEPVRSNYLADLLKRLVKIDCLQVIPAAEVLKRYTT